MTSGAHSSSRLLLELPCEDATECLDDFEELDDATDLAEDEDDVRDRFPVDDTG